MFWLTVLQLVPRTSNEADRRLGVVEGVSEDRQKGMQVSEVEEEDFDQ